MDDWLQRGCIDFHGHVMVDELHGKDEAPFAILSYQPAFHTLHRAALDANPLAFDKIRIGLRLLFQMLRAKKLDFTVWQAKRFAAVADQLPHAGSA